MSENQHNQKVDNEAKERLEKYDALWRAGLVLEDLVAAVKLGHALPPNVQMSLGTDSPMRQETYLSESASAVRDAAEQMRVSVAAARELKLAPRPEGIEPAQPTAEENFG